ncbi:VOC family protein [Kitasatospora aburaviensis]
MDQLLRHRERRRGRRRRPRARGDPRGGPARLRRRPGGVRRGPGGAVFGIWEGPLGRARRLDLPGAPVWIELRTPDPFAAALFYGEVFRWDGRDPERFEVRWEHDRVVLRTEGHSVAALAREQSAGPAGMPPHWEVSFAVSDTDAALARAEALGGSALGPAFDSPYGRVARLQDPEGGRFAVISPKG